ncbi:unnamed protein product [Rotaria sp. Silwood2]|nr:unnamed protein product [Rotaria sp. Silwood2]
MHIYFNSLNIISNTALNVLYKTIREPSFPNFRFEAAENFHYAFGEHEHTASYDVTSTTISENTDFKQNPIEHALINTFTGKITWSICVFYVTHPQTWSTANIREIFSQWNLRACDQLDSITHIIAVSLENDTTETMLTKMRVNDRNLIITSYAVYNDLHTSKIKIKQHDHLFDIDLNKRKSNKRTYDDKNVATSTQEVTPTTATPLNISRGPIENPL